MSLKIIAIASTIVLVGAIAVYAVTNAESGRPIETVVDCDGAWSSWGPCLNGVQTRDFKKRTNPTNGGKACPTPLSEVRACYMQSVFTPSTSNSKANPSNPNQSTTATSSTSASSTSSTPTSTPSTTTTPTSTTSASTPCLGSWGAWGTCDPTAKKQSRSFTEATTGGLACPTTRTEERSCEPVLKWQCASRTITHTDGKINTFSHPIRIRDDKVYLANQKDYSGTPITSTNANCLMYGDITSLDRIDTLINQLDPELECTALSHVAFQDGCGQLLKSARAAS